MTPKNRLMFFLLIFGIITFVFLGFIEIDLFYGARYFVFFAALALYFAVAAVWEKHSERKNKSKG